MRKRCIKILVLFIASCSIAYLTGQKVVLPLTAQKAEQNIQQNKQQEERPDSGIYDLIANFSELSLTGESETDDNPWGRNLTIFEDEERGTCILMTPGTEIAVQYVVQEQETLTWSCNIHPWMAEVSDGVDLTIIVSSMDKDIQEVSKTYQVVPADIYENDGISLVEFQGSEVRITFVVSNGANNDSSGDWLVFNRLMIQ